MSGIPQYAIRTGGVFYYASAGDASITKPDGTNAPAVRSEFDALSWLEAAKLAGFNAEHLFENEEVVYSMNCDDGAFLSTADRKVNITASILQANDFSFLSYIQGSYHELQAGTPVAAENQTTASGVWGYNVPFQLANKHVAAGIYAEATVASVTGGTDGLLVEDTDYFVGLDTNGYTIITIIDSTTVTTEAQDMVIVYAYTPNAGEYNSKALENDDIPFGTYKFVSCPYQTDDPTTPRWRDYIYFTKTKLGGSFVETYLNTGDTFAPSDITLTSEIGGVYQKFINKGTTAAGV